MRSAPDPHLYSDLAEWWPLLSHPSEYDEEAAIYTAAILDALPEAQTLLELGSGGGNNALHMKAHFQSTLVDRSPDMLAVSHRLNPELPHQQGDMRTVRLGQVFDAVFIQDAIMYLTSQADLLAAFRTAAEHLRPGGVLLVAPDCTRETFQASASLGGHDGEAVFPPIPGRALRYLEWTYDPNPADETFLVEFAYLLREYTPGSEDPHSGAPGSGASPSDAPGFGASLSDAPGFGASLSDAHVLGASDVRCVYDRHVNGLFPHAVWLRLLESAGFQARSLPFHHSEVDTVIDMFLARKA